MASSFFAENSLLELLFENNHTPVAYMDLDFNFIHVNQAYALADNKKTDFFKGKNHFSLYPNTENQKIFNDVLKTGITYQTKAKPFEYVDSPEKGETFWDWSLMLVRDDNNQPCGVLLQLLDVTQQVIIEQKLYEKVKKELHDYDKELETIIEARTVELQAAINTLKNEIDKSSEAEALMLKAKDAADKANVSKSQFLSRMSHELRTPMNAILGFSQLLKRMDLDEKQASFNDEILLAGHHLLSMISDILDLSIIESGNLTVSMSDVSLIRVMHECISMVQHKLDFRNIQIHNLIAEDDDITLRVDETRLKEVVVNLLTNAVKYNSDNGLVSIGYKKVGDNDIRIHISDTGKGLSDEEQIQVFEPFNRLGAEYTDIEGVGIGLSISQKLMEMMGGSISLESNKGQGTTFYLDFPIGKEIKSDINIFNGTDLDNKDLHYNILYVEDNISNQKLIDSLLVNHPNFTLTVKASAEEGLEELVKQNFNLVILDINLPGMDGYSALDKINQNAKTKDIPVIALSASASADDIRKGLEAGFNQYVTKPVKLPELVSIINNEINQSEKRH